MGNGIILLIVILSAIGSVSLLVLLNRIFIRIPEIDLDKAFAEAGYDYDIKQNIFYSRMDAWQRDYGYCSLYDNAAVTLGMIYDCEPIRFEYAGKRWLIELWKGQYGMTTGCEMGVYTSKAAESKITEDILYNCADDEDMLPMAFVVKKNNRVLFRRSAVHWWLTGFMLGEFSEPSELSMDIAITLKDRTMMYAFAKKLIEAGYSESEIKVLENSVIFSFITPHSPQPRKRAELICRFSQWRNKLFCKKYRKITRNSSNIYEAAEILKRKAPGLFNRIFSLGKPIKLFGKRIFRW